MVGPSAIGSVKGAPTSITSIDCDFGQYGVTNVIGMRLTSAALLQSQEDVGSIFRCGVTSSNIGYQRGLSKRKHPMSASLFHQATVGKPVVSTPRRGTHNDVLTLFCSLQRLKVCLMASIANEYFVSGPERIWSEK